MTATRLAAHAAASSLGIGNLRTFMVDSSHAFGGSLPEGVTTTKSVINARSRAILSRLAL
jgi:hypothetical protein